MMNFFLMSKHSTVHENVLLNAKILFELIGDKKHIDELFNDYVVRENVLLNLNIERILYLSLVFLYSMELIVIENNMVKKVYDGY
ncbi:hypothetical protein CN890_18425 [Priestia megaterium]|nr:hypothetical protein CN890_18425 [Priestia megaterium]PGO40487.1 hypothetical protein CN973_08520 [Priestia megaterium]RFB19536.1 hypothetical protein DZB87_28370 [Bacillus sp. ALD]